MKVSTESSTRRDSLTWRCAEISVSTSTFARLFIVEVNEMILYLSIALMRFLRDYPVSAEMFIFPAC